MNTVFGKDAILKPAILKGCPGWFFLLATAILFSQNQSLAQSTQNLRSTANPVGAMAANQWTQNGADGYFQPVRIRPVNFAKTKDFYFNVALASENGFLNSESKIFAIIPRKVYRFRISNIALHPGEEIFPTVELINRIFPPKGKELDFPIEIELSKEDVELALHGSLVTKVVYLENPETASPEDTSNGRELTHDVFLGEDPITTAEKFGPIIAVIRLGSRIPTEAPNVNSDFYFGLPPFVIPTDTKNAQK